jgi:putative SOS response-associated peptidase YedK
MCNLYTQSKSVDEVARIFRDLQMPLVFPEGSPNFAPRDIAITDPGAIVRAGELGGYELVVRRWSWPAPNGKPVYNFRSDGREFGSGRCLIIADGFYEFTAPADTKAKRKDRWLFTVPGAAMLGIAGLTRIDPAVGEAFTMLTTEPGPDVAPYHGRQIAVLPPERWSAWLNPAVPARDLLQPLPAGSLAVQSSPR